MFKFFSHPRFLVVYSGLITALFVIFTVLNCWAALRGYIKGTSDKQISLDQITVRRINIVEPDGTARLVLSDTAEFPGFFFKGKEYARPDRSGAGMLFMNDEGTESGGLMFGGGRTSDGQFHSYGHVSFDDYEQDQTISIDADQDGVQRYSAYQINDNSSRTLLTPDVLAAYSKVKSMPEGEAKEKARKALIAIHPAKLSPRASIQRDPDRSVALRLRDPEGHTRIQLRVDADGEPSLQFLDSAGKIAHQWPELSVKKATNGER